MALLKPKVLVTGGAGFIGSHQVDELIKNGYKVVVVDNLVTGKKENIDSKVKFYKIDIRDERELSKVFSREKPEYVFHFAAQMNVNHSVEDPVYDADVNILGGLNVLEGALASSVKKVIFSSTGGALYGEAEITPTPEDYPAEPISPYGIAKQSFEKYIKFYKQEFNLSYAIMRYANVYGPRQNPKGEAGVISIFIEKLLDRLRPTIHGDGHQTRDFIYVKDVVKANLMALENEKSDVYNVGSGRQTTINEIYDYIQKELEINLEPDYKDVFYGQRVSCLSADKIKNNLGWQPQYDMEKGIEKTVKWFLDKKDEKRG